MSPIAMPSTIDPLGAFIAGPFTVEGHLPIPLVSTKFHVEIDGGLVTVATKRVFRNDEPESIEATITFPVPVHAVLFDLKACIDGRAVKAHAQRRTLAREAYEDAIERGKASVLHEEVLRGVHILSLGHIGPGAEIEVSATWASALTYVGDRGQIRIPLTVGDIYGRSGLLDSDELLLGGPVQSADLFVRCSSGAVDLLGGKLTDGCAHVALNAPIDLVVTQAVDKVLHGLAADGREVILHIAPHGGGDTALDVAVVVDHSGSMESACSGRGGISKHKAIIKGLKSMAQRIGNADHIDLWEFDDSLTHIGSSNDAGGNAPLSGLGRQRLLQHIERLTDPAGGTEIGAAISGTIAASSARDILLITDGQSYALDVQKLARSGRRITVVLIGEDSLEANVGHLSALSGGDILVAAGNDIADVLMTAIGSLRSAFERPHPIDASLDRVRVVHGSALLEAEWRATTPPVVDALQARAVAAIAASMALPALDEERAAQLAEAEGLVTHLTSLVLVDEVGEAQDGVPAARKIALPRPSSAVSTMMDMAGARFSMREESWLCASVGAQYSLPEDAHVSRSIRGIPNYKRLAGSLLRALSRRPADLLGIGSKIDWDTSPNQIIAGDTSELDPIDARMIEQAAATTEVIALAKRMNINPIVLIIALIARSKSLGNRSAHRIAKAIIGPSFAKEAQSVARVLGLR
jgi:hypothetical protein